MEEFSHLEIVRATIQMLLTGINGDYPRFSNVYFNMSSGNDFGGPWNTGKTTQFGEEIQFVDDPIAYAMETNGLLQHEAAGTDRTEAAVQKLNKELGRQKSGEVNSANPPALMRWNKQSEQADNKTKQHSDNGNSKASRAKK